MKYLSVCSGIEAVSVAADGLPFEPVAFAEVDRFPSAVLAHHFPHVPNWGDITRFQEWPDATIDLLVGGTPCQSFSVAGLRKGLADPRGNLALTYLAIADRYRPEWVVWENVPGVLSSSGGRDFGAFLGGLGELGYGFAYRVLDAQYFGVPQRRRRVFVVGHLGDWRRAAAVLFERESLSGHPAPRREARENLASSLAARTRGGGGLGTDAECDGGLIPEVSPALKARDYKGPSSDGDGDGAPLIVTHALRAEGFDASEDGTGRGTPIIPIDMRQPSRGATMTNNRAEGCSGGAPGTGIGEAGDPAPTIASSHVPAVAFEPYTLAIRGRGDSHDLEYRQDCTANALLDARTTGETGHAREAANDEESGVSSAMAVRRLTVEECEFLQGFPRSYTDVPYRGKPAADGPRYKALGNSMAVPVVRWILRRLALVHELAARQTTVVA